MKIETAPDLAFFVLLARLGNMTATARELGVTPPAITKRLNLMEQRLGVRLINRTTRRISLTNEGEVYLTQAAQILNRIRDMEESVSSGRAAPKGLLRVNATLGFGRRQVAPVISRFVRAYPEVEVQLQLSVHPPPLTEDSFDVCIRFGTPPDARVIARRLAANQRVLCAAPAYLAQHGTPKTPHELARHNCIGIRQGDEAYGVWRIFSGRGSKQKTETLKARGNLSTNDGEIAVQWALDGHGIVLRAVWDVAHHLDSGRLVQVLAHCQTPEADIYAVIPKQHQMSVRVRSFVDFLSAALTQEVARNP